MSSQFVTKVRRARPSGVALEALADLLSPADSAQVAAAIDGQAENGESLSMRCAGRIAGETYAVN